MAQKFSVHPAGLDSLSDRFAVNISLDGDKPDTKLLSDLPAAATTTTTSGSSSSSSVTSSSSKPAAAGQRFVPGRKSHSGEISCSSESSPAPASRPGHRRSGSVPLIFSGAGAGGSSASSPINVLPCGNICPSGRIGKPAAASMSRSSAAVRCDVLGTGTGNYGHGSIMRSGAGAGGAAGRSPAAVRADPEEITRAGNEHYKMGKFAEALKLYDLAVAMCPENAACRGNRAAALAGLGRIGEAVKECEAAARMDPSNARAHHRLAALHLRLGNVETARRHLFMSAKNNPDPAELRKLQDVEMHLGRCGEARKAGDWKAALREADSAIAAGADASPLLTASRTEALLRLHRIEDADSAMSDATKLAALAPPFPRIGFFGLLSDSYFHIVKAQVEMAMGRFESSVSFAERARETDPRNVEVALMSNKVRAVSRARARGNELFNEGKFADACAAYGEGLELNPSNPVLYCNRAACRFKLGLWEKSIEDCNEALKLRPCYSKALQRRAASYGKLERWAEAVQDYVVIRKELPNNAEVAEALVLAETAMKASRGEDVSDVKLGGGVEEMTSLEQFQSAVSSPGVFVVHFTATSNPQCIKMATFVEQLCTRYPSVNFLKVDINDCPAVAESENARVVPTFKIYKGGARAKEMICPSQQALECSVRHYIL